MTSSILENYSSALADPNCHAVMAQYKALIDNNTWHLAPQPIGANVFTGKWLYKHKFHFDDSLARQRRAGSYVASPNRPGVDYDEMFSPLSNRR